MRRAGRWRIYSLSYPGERHLPSPVWEPAAHVVGKSPGFTSAIRATSSIASLTLYSPKSDCRSFATRGRAIRAASQSYLYPITDLGVTVSALRTYLEQLNVSDRSSGANRWVATAIPLSFPANLALIVASPAKGNAMQHAISYIRVSSEEQRLVKAWWSLQGFLPTSAGANHPQDPGRAPSGTTSIVGVPCG
jgi:hypothetical protein